jgi:Zn-dependent oligopeptidase
VDSSIAWRNAANQSHQMITSFMDDLNTNNDIFYAFDKLKRMKLENQREDGIMFWDMYNELRREGAGLSSRDKEEVFGINAKIREIVNLVCKIIGF